MTPLEEWAERLAATLEPLRSTEAAALGNLAATLDARRNVRPVPRARRAA